ncbi:hypothetical protein, partial [Burkholderia multivorans]|uniref:hypothetical protein n=1 Tax=Burkholderia multivorans TaxID=87883 RepID=UPI00208E7BDE
TSAGACVSTMMRPFQEAIETYGKLCVRASSLGSFPGGDKVSRAVDAAAFMPIVRIDSWDSGMCKGPKGRCAQRIVHM